LKKGGELCYGKERRLQWNGVEGRHGLVYIGEVDLQQRSKSFPRWFHAKRIYEWTGKRCHSILEESRRGVRVGGAREMEMGGRAA
jgi:hypothetical protein